jgi:hypothetical protein
MSESPVVEVLDTLPPATEREQSKFWRQVMEQVQSNRGMWCRVPGVFDPSTATHLRKARNQQVDPQLVEIETRTEPVTAEGRKRVSIFLRIPNG